jgi:hypothetical protein
LVVQRSDISLAVVTMTVRTAESRLDFAETPLWPADALALAPGLAALFPPALAPADGFAAELWPPAAADALGFDALVEPDALAVM